ncbi:MAG: glycosyltransferase family 4 protein [Rhodospirillales bacterium]|nr:glycosyltransferase family 4 protein [Rhodospirillales bacterium]
MALYKALAAQGVDVTFITYGGKEDLALGSRFPEVRVLCNKHGIKLSWYSRLIPFLHFYYIIRSHVIKSNQVIGAEIALFAARLWHKPFLARCGYLPYVFSLQPNSLEARQSQQLRHLENMVFSGSDCIEVTTQAMADDISTRIPEAAPKIRVVPNYVDTEIFCPTKSSARPIDILFVGRLDPQKNVAALLSAIAGSQLRMVIIGQGSLEVELKACFAHLAGQVTWIKSVPHRQLVDYIRGARLFVLPSHFEGHPKTLIEAMACGAVVIGANTPGIREVIEHSVSGVLCEPNAPSIRQAIDNLLDDIPLMERLSSGARQFAKGNYSLNKICEMELEMLRAIISRQPGKVRA